MKVDLEDFRKIQMLIDQEKNIVIFPISEAPDYKYRIADGTEYVGGWFPAYFPIELKFPYTISELQEKIKEGIEAWNQYPCYLDGGIGNSKNTIEEKYYGIKGYRNACKGKLMISLGWNTLRGKFVTLSAPWRGSYSYTNLERKTLPEDADWSDFAKATWELINMDLTKSESFKAEKRKLNLE